MPDFHQVAQRIHRHNTYGLVMDHEVDQVLVVALINQSTADGEVGVDGVHVHEVHNQEVDHVIVHHQHMDDHRVHEIQQNHNHVQW